MRVRLSLAATLAASAWAALVSLVFVPQYVRLLGLEAYGLVGLYVALQAWLLVLDFGLAGALNREMSRFSSGSLGLGQARDLVRSVSIVYAGVAVLIAAGVALAAPWVANDALQAKRLSASEVRMAIVLMGFAVSLQWMGTLFRSALLGLQRQVSLGAVSAFFATLKAGGSVLVLLWTGPTVAHFLEFQCLACAIESGVLGILLRRALPGPGNPRFRKQLLADILPFTAGMGFIALLATLLTQSDKLIIARLLPLEEFAIFSLAVTLAGSLGVLIAPIFNVTFPRLTALASNGDDQRLAREYHRLARFMAVAVLPPAFMLAAFPRDALLLWGGDALQFGSAGTLVSLWAVGSALNGIMHVPYAAQLAHGWSRLTVWLNVTAILLVLPALWWLVPAFGAEAAGWIWIALNAMYCTVGVTVMHTRILRGEHLEWAVRDVLAPALSVAAGGAALWVARASWGPLDRFEAALFLAAGCVLLWCAALLVAPSLPQGRREKSNA